ncbi:MULTISPECIES: hypothetical protein [Pseudomonas]|jgi:uncharacterized membrane protein YphA (DoxX/SURF4 family)|uniref:Uncharacterized protein n=1 Tax=Pseudomonas fluorescens TaxID=294 RepID=A0A5E7MKJ1_PSEFL|nr:MULTISPECIES: hypothetical protein [Pseudomonas]MCP1487869.1 putative membrane protein YphA (DoxX/SURF4 family) [Pseudomonas fluorescens]PRB44583.1 hypothetical protein CQ025_24470 [Pseudomonas sp. MYb3]PRC30162.1 hypothetical protein CQ009_23690 [Pseudomonas sp. MYb2]VVP25304.1 hypothetical protein PS896_04060 [Pseudomonas fluorescens]
MSLKGKIISGYLLIGLIYALYSWLFSSIYSHAGFFYNLGRGLMWPAAMFPALGAFIGGVVLVIIAGAYALSRR